MGKSADGISHRLDVAEKLANLALRRSDTVAIATRTERVSFSELRERVERRAGSISRDLSEIGGDGILPVLVDYSVESMVNIFACLWLRQPFSPIDSATPPARLDFLLSSLGTPRRVLVADHSNWTGHNQAIGPGDDSTSGVGPSTRGYAAGDTGLVVFTSGSTGTPKGVMVPWSTIDFRIENYFESLRRDHKPMKITSLAPLNFVAGLLQLFLVLNGASMLRMNPRDFTLDGILSAIDEFSPTHLFLPPQVFRLLTRVVPSASLFLAECTLVSIGGESVRCEDVHAFRQILPERTSFRHVLAATESMRCMAYESALEDLPSVGQVPVGTMDLPVTTKLVPYDEDLFEVWCSGPIASGYLSDAISQQRSFLHDSDGVLWWKSGDLVAPTPEGTLMHRGRVDDTVKIRGKLASPSELTHQLIQWPGVHGAVVLVEHHNREPYFVAHVEIGEQPLFESVSLEAHLRQTLDSHLVPRKIVSWVSFPLNHHGKVDRAVLARRAANLVEGQ